ncbi:hypothetical protein D3C77_575820 [compost metagenome]
MEIAMVAEAEQVQLKRFALYHFNVGNIADVNRSEIRLARNRAQARKFRAIELHEIIAVGVFIIKAFENAGIIGKGILHFLIAKQR